MKFSVLKVLRTTAIAAIMVAGVTSCGTPKDVVYFQDASPEQVIEMAEKAPITVEPGDELMVYVSCTDPESAGRLSLMAGTRAPETSGGKTSLSSGAVMLPYTVNKEGNINMPEIGTVHVAGLTRHQISAIVEKKILEHNMAKAGGVNVTVQFANLTFTALGEVNRTGTYSINKDNLTVLEALAQAGDLTIYGRRDKVWVVREEPGGRKMYQLDLRGTDFLKSPGYYVQQNDVIYVEPNEVRAGQSTLNDNTFKSVGFWTSLASLAMTVVTMVVTLTR